MIYIKSWDKVCNAAEQPFNNNPPSRKVPLPSPQKPLQSKGIYYIFSPVGNFCRLMKVKDSYTHAMTIRQHPSGKYSTEEIKEKVSVSEGGLVILGAVSKVWVR